MELYPEPVPTTLMHSMESQIDLARRPNPLGQETECEENRPAPRTVERGKAFEPFHRVKQTSPPKNTLGSAKQKKV